MSLVATRWAAVGLYQVVTRAIERNGCWKVLIHKVSLLGEKEEAGVTPGWRAQRRKCNVTCRT